MTNTAKEQILQRVRAALADRPATPEVSRDYRGAAAPVADLVGLFAQRAADYRAGVCRVTQAELPAAIAAIVGAHPVAVPADIDPQWTVGLSVLVDEPPLTVAQLDRAYAVLTTATVAIAETGTVVLTAGPGQGRRVLTLLPDHHVCVIRADQIVADLPAALPLLDPRRPQTWISGPSATSDIELNRVEGVHGPRDLQLLIVTG